MKIECTTNKIKNAIIQAERITGKNLTLPVLGSILLIANQKLLTIRATNLSIGVDIKIPVKIKEEGIVAIRGDILSNLFSNTTKDNIVTFESVDNTLHVTLDNNKSVIKTIPHEDYPTLPIVSGNEFVISSKKLTEGLKSVYYSASISDIKPEIGSVYIYPEDDNLFFVATDSFRLAEKKIKLKQHLDFSGFLLPYKNVVEIIKIFDNINEDITITINKNQASITTPNLYFTTRLVDAVFPDYKQIIPKEYTTTATILKQDFINSLKISNIFSDKFNQITIKIDPNKKVFELLSKNNDIGENTTNVQTALTGEGVEVNFNYKYITDAFQSINTDSITIFLYGNTKPTVIKPVGDNTFMYLVMPMHR
ncbi:DNA polymerase III subunit beta [Candidatus Nomurabacteria bacterium]|nr:DNA polymerase III subunit beta [Candidatus Nomurabacteria bacterium]